MKLIAPILMLLSLANAANDNDFESLWNELNAFYKSNSKMIPLMVRLSYHDLLNQPTAAGKGCIQKSSFLSLDGNGGLSGAVNELKKIIQKDQFKNANFAFGDVVAFAGKVAVETAYPCSNIKFKYNRGECGNQEPARTSLSAAPSPFMLQLREMTPHHQYIGFSLNEFAILTIGAHAINVAAAHRGVLGVDGVFSRLSSGADYIRTTLANTWTSRTVNGVVTFVSDNLLRIRADMLFFPDSKVQNGLRKRMLDKRKGSKKGGKKSKKNESGETSGGSSASVQSTPAPADAGAASVQSTPAPADAGDIATQKKLQIELQNLADFDAQFVRIFEKMLNAGGGSTPYNKVNGCAAPTPPVTTSARPSKTSARPSVASARLSVASARPSVASAPASITPAPPSVTSAPTETSSPSSASSTSSKKDEARSDAKSLIPSSYVAFLALFLF